MHPVLILSYDKSPAITKAVEALEEAGMEVRVLNTGHAKLADFLGALAGEDDDEDDTPKSDDEALEKEPETGQSDAKTEKDDADEEDEPLAKEAMIDGERVELKIVEGSMLVLHPSEVQIGDKTSYKLNESRFSFWPKDVTNITESVELAIGDEEPSIQKVAISSVIATPAMLEVGADYLREAKYPKDSWAMLPAGRAVFDKNKVSPTEVEKQWSGPIAIMSRRNKNSGKEQGLVMVPGKSEISAAKENNWEPKGHAAHHDQTFGYLGHMEVLGHLIKKGDVFEFDGPTKVEGLDSPEAIAKFKAPVYVFK